MQEDARGCRSLGCIDTNTGGRRRGPKRILMSQTHAERNAEMADAEEEEEERFASR